jgi:hypothetical protein
VKHREALSTQHIFEHANPSFKIFFPNPRKAMTNGFFIGKVFIENIRCMKWELHNEKRQKFCGCE